MIIIATIYWRFTVYSVLYILSFNPHVNLMMQYYPTCKMRKRMLSRINLSSITQLVVAELGLASSLASELMSSATIRTVSTRPVHLSPCPGMKGRRIHAHTSEDHFGLVPLTSEFFLLSHWNAVVSLFYKLLLLSLASVILRGYFFVSFSHNVIWGLAAKGVAFRLPGELATKPSFDPAELAAYHPSTQEFTL